MAEKELRDLKTILDEDLHKDHPFFNGIELAIWTNTTKKCSPVIRNIKLEGIGCLDYDEVQKLLLTIDSVYPIVVITIKGYKVYRVTKTEDFAVKKCEV